MKKSEEPALCANIVRLVELGLSSAEAAALHPAERANVYAAAAHILREVDDAAADLAASTAGFIRAAEDHQLKFARLLKSL